MTELNVIDAKQGRINRWKKTCTGLMEDTGRMRLEMGQLLFLVLLYERGEIDIKEAAEQIGYHSSFAARNGKVFGYSEMGDKALVEVSESESAKGGFRLSLTPRGVRIMEKYL